MKNRILLLAVGTLFAALAYFVIYRSSLDNNRTKPAGVVTSFYPMYFLAQEIGGEELGVKNLVPPGVEPHDYELTSQDLMDLEAAKIVLILGGVEPWSEDIANTKFVRLGDPGEPDPHVWLSPQKYIELAKKVGSILRNNFPTQSDNLLIRQALLESRLRELDTKFSTTLSGCKKREIVVSHAAFGNLTSDYGLVQMAISGISPNEEPTSRSLAVMTDYVKKNGVSHVFFESLISPELSETIAREAGVGTMVLNPIEGLTSEELARGENYFTIMEENLSNLKIALQCQ